MHYYSLYALHFIYYAIVSGQSFLPKYFGEIGLTDGQIGMLMSLPAIVGALAQPLFGTMSDRVRRKRSVLITLSGLAAVICLLLNQATGFWLLMLGMIAFSTMNLSIQPIATAISLEYLRGTGQAFGPVRMVGSIGYQAGVLLIGAVFVRSLQGLMLYMAGVMALTCLTGLAMPPVAGHQHGREKVNMGVLLRDKRLVALFAMVLVGQTTAAFYMSFYSKHLGDIGMSNQATSLLMFVSVAMEIPFLFFAERIARRCSLWRWLLIGCGINAVRWVGLGLFTQMGWLMVIDLTRVTHLATFEFFPSLYLNQQVPRELRGSAQMLLVIVSFGVAKVIGSMAGGFVSDWVGIPTVFIINGVLLLVAMVTFWRPARQLMAQERAQGVDPLAEAAAVRR